VSPAGLKSNSRTHASKVGFPLRAVNCASPAVPTAVLGFVDAAPAACVAVPLVSNIPLSKLNVEGPEKVPFDILAQVNVGEIIVIPEPNNLLARADAVAPDITVICARHRFDSN